jgi:broad specificity phosphatase PhoE
VAAKVHLVRHGSHGEVGRVLSGRGSGLPLSLQGRAQAQWLGGWFARQGVIAAIHSSPQLRTRETAEAIASRLGLPVTVVDALAEIDFGTWTGRSFDDLAGDPAWADWNEQRATARVPDGESMGEAVARAVAHDESIAQGDDGQAVVCVSHCDVIRGVVAHYLSLGLNRLLTFDVDPGSVTTLLVGGWGGRLTSLNRGME